MAVARTMCYAGTKSARPFIAPFKLQWELTLTEPLRPCYLGSNRRSRSDGRKLSIPSTFRTPASRRGAPSTNSLAGLDAPLACVGRVSKFHHLTTREKRGTQDREPRVHQAHQQGAVRPMEDLRKTVSLSLIDQSNLLPPSGA